MEKLQNPQTKDEPSPGAAKSAADAGVAADDPLMEKITTAAEGLFVVSESDSPLTPFRWPGFFAGAEVASPPEEDLKVRLRGRESLSADAPLETVTLKAFFQSQVEPQEGDDDEIKDEKRRLTELRDLMANELQGVTVLRAGEIQITAYVLGRVPGTEDAVGVSALLVET
ncbi:MAG: hypothetical protein H7Z41_10775 [Cytophagales bacterium]|nr:hypothetical protein [Armatimonadota bacterium]